MPSGLVCGLVAAGQPSGPLLAGVVAVASTVAEAVANGDGSVVALGVACIAVVADGVSTGSEVPVGVAVLACWVVVTVGVTGGFRPVSQAGRRSKSARRVRCM